MTIFPELFDQDLQIVQINVADEITVTLRTTSPTAQCPDCETVSKWVQSRYKRNLHDLPMSGRPVRLILEVRRFFCKKSTCPRKIFAEQLPSLYRPHAQRTKRLQEALCRLGLALGGQAAEDISGEQGMSGSRDTILRLIRQSSLPNPKAPRVIGLDDWAWKRGHRYGTLICDLEQRQPIALLPDRRAETVSAWLQASPSIEIVSRDGSSEYASAIKKGAPQARQVSDRWHLIKNLAFCVQALLAQCLAEVRSVEQMGTPPKDEGARPGKVRYQAQTRSGKIAQQAGRAERLERYESISQLRKQGMTSADIADRVGMPERTVRHWLARGEAPDYKHRSKRKSLVDPYIPYLTQRWSEGCHNGLQLLRELREKGYKGSHKGIYRFLSTLEPSPLPKQSPAVASTQAASPTRPHPLSTLSVQKATWLFFRKPEDLEEEERKTLQLIRQLSPRVETAYQLVEAFLQMARERRGEQLEAWLKAVEASQLAVFKSFTTSVQKDKDAVLAGLTLPWSNGPLEGHVNRLKFIKRSMYGRAMLDLLKLRVTHRSKKSQERKNKNNQVQQASRLLKKPRRIKNGTNSQYTTNSISEVA